MPVRDVFPLQQINDQSLGNASLSASLVLAFAVLSLVLASVGLYGVLSYLAMRRTSETGIRMARGAQRGQVLRLMLGDGLRPAIYGLVVGLAASAGAVRLIESLLYETQLLDPAIFAAVAATLLSVAALACLIPAGRASRINFTDQLQGSIRCRRCERSKLLDDQGDGWLPHPGSGMEGTHVNHREELMLAGMRAAFAQLRAHLNKRLADQRPLANPVHERVLDVLIAELLATQAHAVGIRASRKSPPQSCDKCFLHAAETDCRLVVRREIRLTHRGKDCSIALKQGELIQLPCCDYEPPVFVFRKERPKDYLGPDAACIQCVQHPLPRVDIEAYQRNLIHGRIPSRPSSTALSSASAAATLFL
jgi:hypothetical protein